MTTFDRMVLVEVAKILANAFIAGMRLLARSAIVVATIKEYGTGDFSDLE